MQDCYHWQALSQMGPQISAELLKQHLGMSHFSEFLPRLCHWGAQTAEAADTLLLSCSDA